MVETALQVTSLVLAIFAASLAVIAIWLSLYFFKESTALHTSLTDIVSRIEASSKATEVASRDVFSPSLQQSLASFETTLAARSTVWAIASCSDPQPSSINYSKLRRLMKRKVRGRNSSRN